MNRRLRAMQYERYVLCLASVDYRHSMGGLGRYLRGEMELLGSVQVSSICLFPFPTKRSKRLDRYLSKYWGVIVDGKLAGFYGAHEILSILAELGRAGRQLIETQLHHVKHFNLTRVAELLAAAPFGVKLFLHDYYTICPGAHLLRNGKQYCGAAMPGTEKCAGCVHWTPPHHACIRSFLEGVRDRLTVVAPSSAAREVWLSTFGDFCAQTVVVAHLKGEGILPNPYVKKPDGEPVRVAYVGAPVPYKGWDIFRLLAENVAGRGEEWEFYHFGLGERCLAPIRSVPVSFVKDGLDAMTQAIRDARIDIVLLWALWPETYSYTLYESALANTMVITNPDSGNIASAVEGQQLGKIFRTESELHEYFRNEEQVRQDVDAYRGRPAVLPFRMIPNADILDSMDLAANPRLPPVTGLARNVWHVEALYWVKLLKMRISKT